VALMPTGEIVAAAAAQGMAVGALNVIGVEHAEGLVAGAVRSSRALVLQISENCVRYHGCLEPITAACLALAEQAPVPVAVHLDHAESRGLIREAVGLGLSSVMYDASKMAYDDNVESTRQVTDEAHASGIWVEAELGEVGGKDGVHAPNVRTDPDEAVAFVRATGVDALAVAVGSSHAMATRDAVLDLSLVERLRAALQVPLVLHGGSGVPDDELARAVAAGMVKINLSTQLNRVFTLAVRTALGGDAGIVDPRRYLAAGREAVAVETARLLKIINAVPAAMVV